MPRSTSTSERRRRTRPWDGPSVGGVDEDRPWRGEEPTTRPDATFAPLAVAVAVFFAVLIPFVVWGFVDRTADDGYTALLGGAIGVALGLASWLALTARR